jgi:hypothetical protein
MISGQLQVFWLAQSERQAPALMERLNDMADIVSPVKRVSGICRYR